MNARFLIIFVSSAVVLGVFGAMTAQARVIATDETAVVRSLIVTEARRAGVPPGLALAVGHVESAFQAHVTSHAGARGVMQIMPATARGEFGVAAHRLYDAALNVRLGVQFLRHLHQVYGRWDIALSHYNGGSRVRRPDGSLQIIPATRSYVRKVLALKPAYDAILRHDKRGTPVYASAYTSAALAAPTVQVGSLQRGAGGAGGIGVYQGTPPPSQGQSRDTRHTRLSVALTDMDAALAELASLRR